MPMLPETDESAALAAIRTAHKNPRVLSATEEQAFWQFRSRSRIRSLVTRQLTRRGRVVYRVKGRRGGDLPCFLYEWEAQKALLKYQQLTEPSSRQVPDAMLGVQSRQTKAQARARRVLELYPAHQHRGRNAAALIARKLKEKDHYVRRILRENVHDRRN